VVALAESRVRLKHLFCTIGFKHGLSGLDGVLFRDVYREMHVTSAKTKVAEFKPEAFKILERLGTGIEMRLFFETVVVVFSFKHHGHPIVSCINRWFFKTSATYYIHIFGSPVASLKGRRSLPHATKK
jgi:hypothetical protein